MLRDNQNNNHPRSKRLIFFVGSNYQKVQYDDDVSFSIDENSDHQKRLAFGKINN